MRRIIGSKVKWTAVLLTLAVMAGCSGQSAGEAESNAAEATEAAVTAAAGESAEGEAGTIGEEQEPAAVTETAGAEDLSAAGGQDTGSSSVVVYFSRVGNTEFPADTDAVSSASLVQTEEGLNGNAQLMAEWIADESGSDLVELVTEDPYPVDYNETTDQAKTEQGQNFRPALKQTLEDADRYDTVYLVYPNWWGDLPMPVYSFLEETDLSGKTIAVFATHEGSGFSGTVNTVQELEPDARVQEGLSVKGGSVPESEQQIREWIQKNS